MDRSPLVESVRESYKKLDAETIAHLDEFLQRCSEVEIQMLRRSSLESIMSWIELEMLAREYADAPEGQMNVKGPHTVSRQERLGMCALAWYHANEFWNELEK